MAQFKPRADLNGGLHHRARIKRVRAAFHEWRGESDGSFDHKPRLAELHGQTFDPGGKALVEAVTSTPGNVMKSPFKFKQHGECGRWVSSVFPQTATCVDDMTFFMSMVSKIERAWAGELHAEYRFYPAGVSGDGGVDFLWPGAVE